METKKYKLSEVSLNVTDGEHGTVKDDNNGNYFLLSCKNIKNGLINITSNERKINEESFYKIQKRIKLEKNDVLITTVGTIGEMAIIEDENINYCFQRSVGIIKPNKEFVNPYFLYYSLRNELGQIATLIKGAVQKCLFINDMKMIEVSLPDLKTQNKIVKALQNIDKKIKLNNEINNNLYEISKQLLLKYLDENKSSDEINISKFLNIFTGKKNANETSPTGKYKFFSCAPESLLSDTYLCDSAAIIVAGNGAYTGRTRFYYGKFELYQRTYGLTLKDGFEKNNIYGLYVFMKTIFEPDKMGGTHGSAIPYIVLSDLTDYKLKYNKVEFDRFSNLVSGNIKMIQENEKSNEKLSELRDTLLPKLMNGEIDLDNIEI